MGLDIYFHKTRRQEIGYFRKVNFLVRFFFEEYSEIVNCCPIRVTKEMCTDLYNRCKIVLENNKKSEELLPTTTGFFFGNTEYNEDYFDDIKRVKEYLEEILLPTFDELEPGESIEFEIWY